MFNDSWTERCIKRAREEFADFEAEIRDLGEVTMINWRNRNGSGNWAVRYILDDCRLIITGDIGNAIFRRAEPYTLEYCSTMIRDPEYNAHKCVAKERESGLYTWDRASVKDDLDKYFADFSEENGYSAEEVSEVEDIKADLYDSCGYNGIEIDSCMDYRLSSASIAIEDYNSILSCGMQYSLHYIAWLVGLQMIAEQHASNVLYGPKIKLNVTNGKKLVAEINPDPDYKEIFLYLEDEEGAAVQDMVIVGESYSYAGESGSQSIVPHPGKYAVRVYGDAYDECYTDYFDIREYDPEINR